VESVSPRLNASLRRAHTSSSPAVVKANSMQREQIEAALTQTKGKVSGQQGAAAKLGMPPSTLESRIHSLKINKFQFKGV